MKKVLLVCGLLLAVGVSAAAAQMPVRFYDPYFNLPGEAGAIGAYAGISTADISSIADAGDVFVAAKYGVSDKIEAGIAPTFGILHEVGDFLSSVEAGAKYRLSGQDAVSANVHLPIGDLDDPGLAIGYMCARPIAGIPVNKHLQVGLLDAYAVGVKIDALIEPYRQINDQLTGYLDLMISTDTDDLAGDYLAINLGANANYMVSGLCVRGGVTLGLAGDAKQADPGLMVTVMKSF